MSTLDRAFQTSAMALRAARRTAGVFGNSAAYTAAYAAVGTATRFDQATAARWTRRWCAALTRGFGLGVDVTGTPPTRGALIVSNHRSYVDIVAVGGLVEACFIAKAELQRWPVLGPTFRISSTIFVDRGNPDSGRQVREQVQERLSRGLSVINFAEGTTHGGTGLLPFKMGLFKTVLGLEIPVVPTTLTYSGMDERVEWIGDDTFFDHFLRLAGHRAMRARIHFGDPVSSNDFSTVDELVWALRQRMLRDLAAREPIDPADYPELVG